MKGDQTLILEMFLYIQQNEMKCLDSSSYKWSQDIVRQSTKSLVFYYFYFISSFIVFSSYRGLSTIGSKWNIVK